MAVAFISTAMITSCVSNMLVTKLTSKAGSSIYNYLFKQSHSIDIPIDEYIQRIDIKEKIIISNAFIESITTEHVSVKRMITSMQDVLIEIEALLNVIEKKKSKLKKKYFNKYRSVHVSKEQKKLVIYDDILSKRLDYLIKLLSLA